MKKIRIIIIYCIITFISFLNVGKSNDFRVNYKNGTEIICQPQDQTLLVRTSYDIFKVPFSQIDSMEFKILKSPKFKTALNNMECDNGIINLLDLIKADSLKINYDCITFNYILNISKFNITIVPKMGEIKNFALKQNLITQEIKEKFIELKTGDIIIFDGVRSVNKNGLIRALTPIIFTIYNN